MPTLTRSLHTRRTQTRFLFEHLQRRHGSVDGINDVSANSVLLCRHPDAVSIYRNPEKRA